MPSPRNHLVETANTEVPAILILESKGWAVTDESTQERMWATAVRGDESLGAQTFVGLLGLVTLVEARGWDCFASDEELDTFMIRMGWRNADG